MKKLFFPLLALNVFISSCSNVVEDINKDMQKKFETEMSASLDPVVSTISFYNYAVPENYWYSEETTLREIIDDEFEQGYKGMEKLDNVITEINTNDVGVKDAISDLHDSIKVEKKALRKARKSLQQLNGMFGLGLFGGANTLLDFAELLGGNKDKEDEGVKMPKNVRDAFDKLVNAIENSDYKLLNNLRQVEITAIGSHKLNDEQLNQVRQALKQLVSNSIKQQYTDIDTVARNKMITMVLTGYDNSFPIASNNTHDVKAIRNATQITAEQLAEEYFKDEKSADQQYLNKLVKVSGTVKEETPIDGKTCLLLTLESETHTTEIACFMSKEYETNFIGKQVTVQGYCGGLNVKSVHIMECKFVD